MVNTANLKVIRPSADTPLSPGQAAIRATSGAPLPMSIITQQQLSHGRRKSALHLADEYKQPQLTQFETEEDSSPLSTPHNHGRNKDSSMAAGFAALKPIVNAPTHPSTSENGPRSINKKPKRLAEAAARTSGGRIAPEEMHRPPPHAMTHPVRAYMTRPPEAAPTEFGLKHIVESQAAFDSAFGKVIERPPSQMFEINMDGGNSFHLSIGKHSPQPDQSASTVDAAPNSFHLSIQKHSSQSDQSASAASSGMGIVRVISDAVKNFYVKLKVKTIGQRADSDTSTHSVEWDTPVGPINAPLAPAVDPVALSASTAIIPSSKATAPAKPRHSLRDVIASNHSHSSDNHSKARTMRSTPDVIASPAPSSNRAAVTSNNTNHSSISHRSTRLAAKIHQSGTHKDDPISLDDDDDSQQHSQQLISSAAAPIRRPAQAVHQSVRLLEATDPTIRSVKEAGIAAAARGEYTSIDSIIGLYVTDGISWKLDESQIFCNSPPTLTFKPEGLLLDYDSRGTNNPRRLNFLIPIHTIRRIEIERFQPFRIIVKCTEPFFVPDCNKNEVDGDLSNSASSNAVSIGGSLRLCVTFDRSSSIQGDSFHAITATDPHYANVIFSIMSSDQRREKSRTPSPPPSPPSSLPSTIHQISNKLTPLQRGDFHLVYPPSGKDSVIITSADLAFLQPQQFLNDSLVDFALKYIWMHLPSETQKRFYFFNSFFYTKWITAEEELNNKIQTKAEKAAAALAMKGEGTIRSVQFQSVSRWAKGIDLFAHDFLVIPICENTHWSLAIICYPELFFQPKQTKTSVSSNGQHKRGHTGASASSSSSSVAGQPASKRMRKESESKSQIREISKSDEEEEQEMDVNMTDAEIPATAAASVVPSNSSPPPSFTIRESWKIPAILYLDSLLPVPPMLYNRLSQYLREAWAARYPPPHPHSSRSWHQPPYIGGVITNSSSTSKNISREVHALLSDSSIMRRNIQSHHINDPPLYEMKVPEQKNGCDCGLFMIEYTERFCRDGPILLKKYFEQRQSNNGGNYNSNRFEEIFFKNWKGFSSSMSQKRKQLLNLIKREENLIQENINKAKEFQQQTNAYKSILVTSSAAASSSSAQVRPMKSVTLTATTPSTTVAAAAAATVVSPSRSHSHSSSPMIEDPFSPLPPTNISSNTSSSESEQEEFQLTPHR
jgi:hypothetical protein